MPFSTNQTRRPVTNGQCYYCGRFGQAARRRRHNKFSTSRRFYYNTQPAEPRPSKSRQLFVVDTGNSAGLPLLTLRINSQNVTALIDTGAICSLIHRRMIQGISYQRHSAQLTTANGTPLHVIGKATLPISSMGKVGTLTFAITDHISWHATLGTDFLRLLGRVTVLHHCSGNKLGCAKIARLPVVECYLHFHCR